MEDNKGKKLERGLRRCFEGNRLEEQLWAMAYEQVWPMVRRSLKRCETWRRDRSDGKTQIARRA